MLLVQNLEMLYHGFRNRKAMSLSVRILMGLFLAILFAVILAPPLLSILMDAGVIASCDSPYMAAIASLVADATDNNIC